MPQISYIHNGGLSFFLVMANLFMVFYVISVLAFAEESPFCNWISIYQDHWIRMGGFLIV
ncbi:hypothetical protein SLEP1_g832 [Rubroshorea leprosula]|uniref:Uncharacterized protein n=1 Tax=Rubroshorea leprosula TaxID=152421 RepID=A0AAV5HM97_9ROSI|nr:hypothetical protein SLEP1_g832 [Rubroshorea leprosula]